MLTSPNGVRHAKLVESVVRGGIAHREIAPLIRHSWSRCLQRHALDPQQVRRPTVVERGELQMRREQLGPLLQIARIEMIGLCRHMSHTDYGIVLTDRDGVIVHYVGEPGFTAQAKRSGLREGAIWSEREQGTNGMGTCLVEQRALVVHREEHFLAQNSELTCSAAPIFNPRGELIAALDISGRTAEAQAHTLTLAKIGAQNIENRLLLDEGHRYYLLRFHRHAQFVNSPYEGLIAFDQDGRVVGANRIALEQLGLPDHAALCQRSLDELFENGLGHLLTLALRRPFRCEPLRLKLGREPLWGALQPPDRPSTALSATPVVARAGDAPVPTGDAFYGLEFGDPLIADNLRVVRRVLDRNIPILLLGETGTGKGYLAKAIHQASKRANKPFVTVNCAAIPETLIESELFGYRPGAFTGATREGHTGLIVQANGGTLFLDEIGDIPLPLQTRLLSVVEDREVLPLGGSKPIPVDIHLISATHRDLAQRVREGSFREDLYYRLNGLSLRMPPLRERSDTAAVIRHLLRLEAGDRGPVEIEEALLQRLLRHSWPGNLRELRNVLRTMLALAEGPRLTCADLKEDWLRPPASARVAAETPAAQQPPATQADDEGDVLAAAEREALRRVLDACHWNISVTAARLNMSRKTLYRKLHRHGMSRAEANRENGR
ncbi:MAG: sigma-54-dependent Fis family transcriptional regulator [Sinobacteraceae bacterium]|nr:sigma-54-dependent Fis family transcriptional regulator [Nevskiaceae bacterium]